MKKKTAVPNRIALKMWKGQGQRSGSVLPNHSYSFPKKSLVFTAPRKRPFENIVEQGENAGNQRFLLLPQCFLLYQTQIFTPATLNLSSAFNLVKAKILSFGTELKVFFVLFSRFYFSYKHLKVTHLISWTIWFSQSEVVLLSNRQNLDEKDK